MSRARLWGVGSASIVVDIVVNFDENIPIDAANSPKQLMGGRYELKDRMKEVCLFNEDGGMCGARSP